MENIIVVKDFEKKYGDFTAVDHVSFEVERGSIFLNILFVKRKEKRE